MSYSMFSDLINTNLDELETRDTDLFYNCTLDNAEELLGRKLTGSERAELLAEIASTLSKLN